MEESNIQKTYHLWLIHYKENVIWYLLCFHSNQTFCTNCWSVCVCMCARAHVCVIFEKENKGGTVFFQVLRKSWPHLTTSESHNTNGRGHEMEETSLAAWAGTVWGTFCWRPGKPAKCSGSEHFVLFFWSPSASKLREPGVELQHTDTQPFSWTVSAWDP